MTFFLRRRRCPAGAICDVCLLLLSARPGLAAPLRQLPDGGRRQAASAPAQQPLDQGQTPSLHTPPEMTPAPLTPKQQRAILKSNYEKMKGEADELASLAKALQDELNKSNQEILSLHVVDRADKIEKLAKKIKSEAVR